MSAIKNFASIDYGELTVFVDDHGKEWFRAIDACKSLNHGNVTQAIARHVDPEYVTQIDDGTNRAGLTNYISEPGFYQLIFGSKTLKAKGFQKWVFEEVLPKLRADRLYIMPAPVGEQIQALEAEISRLEAQNQKNLEYANLKIQSECLWAEIEEVCNTMWLMDEERARAKTAVDRKYFAKKHGEYEKRNFDLHHKRNVVLRKMREVLEVNEDAVLT